MRIPVGEICQTIGLQSEPMSPTLAKIMRPFHRDDSKGIWCLHPERALLAVGHGQYLSLIHLPSCISSSAKKRKHLAAVVCEAPSRITAVCWLCHVSQRNGRNSGAKGAPSALQPLASHVMVGTEKGDFLVFDMLGVVVVRQKLHASGILTIRPRVASMGLEREGTEEVSVTFPDMIVCIPLPELLAFIRFHEVGAGQAADPSLKIAHGKYDVSKKCGHRTDGINLGKKRPSLKSVLAGKDSGEEVVTVSVVAVGKSPCIGGFDASLSAGSGGALAMFGRLASSMTLGVSGMAWSMGRRAWKSGVTSLFSSGQKEETLVDAVPAKLRFSLRDSKRQVTEMIPSPSGCLGVTMDTFGRVILFDTGKMLVVRMWKGYREAQCAWIRRKEKNRPSLFLAIYAPRREVLEVWPVRCGPRKASFQVSSINAQLLGTIPPMALDQGVHWDVDCCLLELDSGEIWSVSERIFGADGEAG
ncbi:hypothetical protein BSKO_05060 [Bryopsis sp. KO-2023]|nr:hypothetical protein BSKO_05060 [Bryopsis sp. KO-2023]